MKKLIGLIVTLSLIFACGCEKQEQNQGENGSSNEKKDVVSTLVCTKTTEEDGEKSTNVFEITSKDNIVKKVTNITTAEVDEETIDLVVSISEAMVKSYNEVEGMEASVKKEGNSAFKISISVDYDKFNVEQAKEKLGDIFEEEDFLSEKNISVNDFIKQNAEDYDCK